MSLGGEFRIDDLFITHRLVALSAEAIVRTEGDATAGESRRWSILLWGDRRSQAAQAAAWIGKVVGTG